MGQDGILDLISLANEVVRFPLLFISLFHGYFSITSVPPLRFPTLDLSQLHSSTLKLSNLLTTGAANCLKFYWIFDKIM